MEAQRVVPRSRSDDKGTSDSGDVEESGDVCITGESE
jgi:hypothetical protein